LGKFQVGGCRVGVERKARSVVADKQGNFHFIGHMMGCTQFLKFG